MTKDTNITDRLMAETAATVQRIADLSDELFRLSGQLWVIADWSGQRDIFDWSQMAHDAGSKVEKLRWSLPDVIHGINLTLPIRALGDPAIDKKQRSPAHYHILSVRDPGGPHQVAECAEQTTTDPGFTRQYLDEIHRSVWAEGHIPFDGWDAIWIVGCGPGACRRGEICDLPVEEWGEPYFERDRRSAPDANDSYW